MVRLSMESSYLNSLNAFTRRSRRARQPWASCSSLERNPACVKFTIHNENAQYIVVWLHNFLSVLCHIQYLFESREDKTALADNFFFYPLSTGFEQYDISKKVTQDFIASELKAPCWQKWMLYCRMDCVGGTLGIELRFERSVIS